LIEVDVLRDRNALYRTLSDGRIENVYTIRAINKDTHAHDLKLRVEGLSGAMLDTDQDVYRIAAGEVISIAARVRVASNAATGGSDIDIVATSTDSPSIFSREKARFIAPRQ
jgi:polyferredoxin